MTGPLPNEVLAALDRHLPAAVALRHRLHADPRGSGDETDTAELVAAALGAPGVTVAKTGRLVQLGDGDHAIALRSELDALPVVERTGAAWASANGFMHACGHDVHLAALVAACAAIADTGGGVTALLQPREESSPSGAADVVESGVLADHGIRAVVGAHLQPAVESGTIAVTPGLVNASSDELELLVTGRGGHAGYPHTVADPVLALANAVLALQQVAARRVDPVHGAVCMITEIHAGTAANVVPDVARARGTLRLMRNEHRSLVAEQLREIAEAAAATYGCTAELTVTPGEPVLDNDPALARAASAILVAAGWTVRSDFRSFGADDFSHFGTVLPALMLFVGVGRDRGAGLHDPSFLPPDEAIGAVAQALVAGYLGAAAAL
ncbi:MAG TPA: M20 family metallopeptidase [Jatrophihabitans sp.]|nr:M20 family metallopeptidase [Jatrophihabitans sp.]